MCPPHSCCPHSAGAKNGRNGTKFTAHHGELLLPCGHIHVGDGHSCSSLNSKPTWPQTLPGMMLWAACSSASHPHREEFLLCINKCLRESRAQLPWGQCHCQSLWLTQNLLLGHTVCHPEHLISSVPQASGSYSV